MPIENLGHEYEFEPQFGLPERLPSDESIVWQGSPDVGALASSAFHIKKLAIYFAVLIAACAWPALEEGAGVMAVLMSIKWIAPLALIGLGSVWMLAYLTSRTTVYTLTNKRIVMRLGIVFTVSFNLPLKQVAAADVRMLNNGFGDNHFGFEGFRPHCMDSFVAQCQALENRKARANSACHSPCARGVGQVERRLVSKHRASCPCDSCRWIHQSPIQ